MPLNAFWVRTQALVLFMTLLSGCSQGLDELRKNAENGDANAQALLGGHYARGKGVQQDFTEAARWYRRAADQGDAFAQYNLGVSYAEGQGVPQDYIAAHMWLSLAALRGSGEEQKQFTNARDVAAKKMTPEQIAEAQRLAQEWKPKAESNANGAAVK
jgi:uncharacterized protein